jgi:hypothetical protein
MSCVHCRCERRYVETVEALLRRWGAAEAAGDVAALDAMLDADFRGDGPNGYVLDKQQWLDRHRGGDLVIEAFTWKATEIRATSHTAIGIGTQSQVARYQGADRSGDFCCTLVAIRRQGRWVIVNLQLSRGYRPPG